jgi:hypothetical protein
MAETAAHLAITSSPGCRYGVAVGTALAGRPPPRTRRAGLPHRAPTSGDGVKAFGAVSGRGGFRYRVQLDYFSQETFRAFLMAFRASTNGYLIFILDGAPYHKGEAITDFVEDPRNEMGFVLPARLQPRAESAGTGLESFSKTTYS